MKDKITVDGKTYERRPRSENSHAPCEGCAARDDGALCAAFPDCTWPKAATVFVLVQNKGTPIYVVEAKFIGGVWAPASFDGITWAHEHRASAVIVRDRLHAWLHAKGYTYWKKSYFRIKKYGRLEQ